MGGHHGPITHYFFQDEWPRIFGISRACCLIDKVNILQQCHTLLIAIATRTRFWSEKSVMTKDGWSKKLQVVGDIFNLRYMSYFMLRSIKEDNAKPALFQG